MTKNNVIITIVVAIIVGTLGFFGGMKYGQSKQPGRGQMGQKGQTFQQNGQNGGTMRSNSGSQFISGEVLNKDNKSFTIKLQNGSSKIILYSDSTNISKSATGTLDDILTGRQISVTGSTNSDGSLTAQAIQVRPESASSTPPAASK